MEDIYEQIFEMAIKEVPNQHFRWEGEEVVIYKGFRISKKDGEYFWKDARHSDYFDPVDPDITEKILEIGFKKTIIEVMRHTDKDRLLDLKRKMEKLDAETKYWVKEASKAYNKMIKKTKNEVDQNKIKAAKSKYEKDKSKFLKKRGVVKSEKDALQSDIDLFESRIKMYNN